MYPIISSPLLRFLQSTVLHPWIQATKDCVVLWYIFSGKKNSFISGPAQFKSVWLKGLQCAYICTCCWSVFLENNYSYRWQMISVTVSSKLGGVKCMIVVVFKQSQALWHSSQEKMRYMFPPHESWVHLDCFDQKVSPNCTVWHLRLCHKSRAVLSPDSLNTCFWSLRAHERALIILRLPCYEEVQAMTRYLV